ncbi:hypothetical protein M1L60_19735 [Actinoplanes sp. TRM 88003]|uniref:Uncharacterized protein n=1 Tax=Paractinoplanes aksuensis TaxID=2939490 RepID=A0ABT1DSY7_9ACTN|nr:hypothetical protein [Actinoplanes aksuensis]MCO8272831.1 hypothetical protein [Actinoplanes aksuensis]
MNFLARIAERIHAPHDDDARAQGLTVVRLPGGRRQISHPDLPALFEARRQAVIRNGLDPADLAMLDEGTRQALEATRHRMRETAPARSWRPEAIGSRRAA